MIQTMFGSLFDQWQVQLLDGTWAYFFSSHIERG
jgi:hypothetical protein